MDMQINKDVVETLKHNVLINSRMAHSGVGALMEEFMDIGFDQCIDLACLVSVSINEHLEKKELDK